MKSFGGKKKLPGGNVERYLRETQGLERDLIAEIGASKRMAWRAVHCLTVATVASWMAFAVYVAKTSAPIPPVVIKVNDMTGASEVMTTIPIIGQSMGEVVDGYWATNYVIHRESYDWDTIAFDHRLTRLMSTEEAAREYVEKFKGDQALDKTIGDKARDVVNIVSSHVDPDKGIATVRYTKQRWNRDGTKGDLDHRFVTIAYRYANAPMKADDRQIDPVGFQVTSWRSDTEVVRGGR